MNLKKLGLQVFIILSMLIASLIFLTVSVYGEEKFSDLNSDNIYYDSIMELVNDGVISGYSDGTFKPDKDIYVCEAITILENVFGNSNNLPEWSKWYELTETNHIYETNWDIDYSLFFNDYFRGVNWETGSHLVLSINKVKLLNSEIYGYSNKYYNLSNVQLRGYLDTNEYNRLMTRAEFCDLVVWAKYNIKNIPEYSVEFPIKYSFVGYDDLESRKVFESHVLSAFLRVPNWLLNYYIERNGEIKLVEEGKWDIVNHSNSDALYYHSYNGPIILIRNINYGIALHELGHFVWYSGGLNLSNKIIEEESEKLVNILSSDYCKTNKTEYFAEAFKAFFIHNEIMNKECPKTYKVIRCVCEELEQKYK